MALDRRSVVLRDGAYSCESLTWILGGIGIVAGGAVGLFAGSIARPTAFTPPRRRRFIFGGSLAGLTVMMVHLSFFEPACYPQNRGMGR